METIKFTPSIGVVLFNEDKSKVLLVKHKESAQHLTGVYGFASGRYNPDEEKDIQAAIRELNEETGLTTTEKDLTRIPTIYYSNIKRKSGIVSFSFVVFLCHKYSGSLSSEYETIPEWVDIKDLDNYQLLPNIKEIVQEALDMNK